MCINKRFTYFMYILKFQCFLKTDIYIYIYNTYIYTVYIYIQYITHYTFIHTFEKKGNKQMSGGDLMKN